jgi:hypothetical protein
MAEKHKHKTGVQEEAPAPGGSPHVTAREPEGGVTGALAERFGELFGGFKLGVSRNFVIALGVIALGVVLFFVWRWFANAHADENAKVWFEWERAGDLEPSVLAAFARADEKGAEPLLQRDRRARAELQNLETFARDHQGTMQGRLARFQAARALLYQGLRDLAVWMPETGSRVVVFPATDEAKQQHDAALDKVSRAAASYKALGDESGDVALLAEEALLNEGKAREALAEFDRARECYSRLKQNYSKSRFVPDADRGLARLDAIAKDADLRQNLTDLARRASQPAK